MIWAQCELSVCLCTILSTTNTRWMQKLHTASWWHGRRHRKYAHTYQLPQCSLCCEPHPSSLGPSTFWCEITLLYHFTITHICNSSNTHVPWQTSGLSQGKDPYLLFIYVFLNHVRCVKLDYHFYLFPSFWFCVTDKGFECCVPNPIFARSLTIFIAQNCIAWWFLGTHRSC